MTVFYADTSAVARAYFADEEDHETLRQLLLEGPDPVISSELTRVEFASTVSAAERSGRIDTTTATALIDQFDLDCGDERLISLLRLDGHAMSVAHQLVQQHMLRSLGAIHLAVLLTSGVDLAAGDDLVLVTRDKRQAAAGAELGFTVT